MTARLLNATTDLVAERVKRSGAPIRFPGFQNPPAARRAVASIRKSIQILAAHPQIGRPIEDMAPEFREWPIAFGASGYVALYRLGETEIIILTLRHGHELNT